MAIDPISELIARVQAYDRCWTSGRPADVRAFLHPRAVFAGPRFQRLARGGDACAESYVKFLAQARVHDFSSSDYEVDVADHSAVMTYRWTIDYEIGDSRSVETGRDALVWVRYDDNWVIFWRVQQPDAAAR